MRLLEAIIEANHRAPRGDQTAALQPGEYADSLPLIALTCIDPRLNPLMPEVLGIAEDKFIWLRNSGNIIFDPLSSMTRTLAVACALKQGREIAIIGHTDCLVGKTSTLDLTERFRQLGVDRSKLPDNLHDFFGLFASERQNVMRSCQIVRSSPLIGPKIPVHGLIVDVTNGRLEWLVNGYEELERASATSGAVVSSDLQATVGGKDAFASPTPAAMFADNEMKFPDFKIGQPDLQIGSITPKSMPSEVKLPESTFAPIAPIASADVKLPAPVAPTTPMTPVGTMQPQSGIGGFATRVEKIAGEIREVTQAKTTAERVEKIAEVVADVTGSDKVTQWAGNIDLIAKLGTALKNDMEFTIIGHDQKRYGPVSTEKLIRWLSEGRIDHNTPVQLNGTASWQPMNLLADTIQKADIPLPPKWKWGNVKKTK